MADDPENSQNLSIRCPSCRQRFSVDSELMDRMVECGGCESRFRINEEVIIRTKKFYPGERKVPELDHFQRVPLSVGAVPEGLQTMRYQEFSHPERLGPASPQRVIAGIAGVALMVFIALIFIFSNGPGSAFSEMPTMGKLIIAGFVSLLGSTLLIYANPNGRKKAIFFAFLFSAVLISLPLFYKGGTESAKTTPIADDFAAPTQFPEMEKDPIAELRERFTTKPLEEEQERLAQEGGNRKAFGIYLTNLVQRNIYTARDFLIRDTGAGPSSHPFPRDGGDYLVILTEVEIPLDEVVEVAGKLGEVQETHEEIGVVVVRVDNAQFLAGSAEKLNNKDDPAFYELNMYELQSIDLDRVRRAVERIADTEPTIYRSDISGILTELMTKSGVTFHDQVARALLVWAEDPGPAAAGALKVIRSYYLAQDLGVPESLGELVARSRSPDAIETMAELWEQTPTLWDQHMVNMGSDIEPVLLEKLDSEQAPLKRSAIRMLGQIGTTASLPRLRELTGSEDPEVRVLAERAISGISAR